MASIVLSLVLLLLVPFAANSVHFKIPGFDADTPNILYQGDAVSSVGTVELNNADCTVGWVTYADWVRLWDSATGKLSDFTTHFSFMIDTLGQSIYGDGMAFFLAPAGFQIPPNSVGGFLGLYNSTTSELYRNQIVMVEFDTSRNAEWDPPFGHVGINNYSLVSAEYTPWNASLHSGDTADALISYNGTTNNLTVSWKYRTTSNSFESSGLFQVIDLREGLPEWVTIGFTASTGLNAERHVLQSWEFSSSLDTNGDHSRNTIRITVGVAVSGFLALVGAFTGLLTISWRRKQKSIGMEAITLASINEDLERGAGPRKFSYQELISATNKFPNERKLGEGGSGAVYKGYLTDVDLSIAVKKISRGSKQGKRDYINELKTISQLRHRNLVQLLGWCHDKKGDFLLVYEFMPNGSLDSHLFGNKLPLAWPVRYRAAIGLASALRYLHDEWEQCVVHRDVKASNIMLDSNFNIKLGDFGLARLIEHGVGPKVTGLAGTRGYMAPEYISSGRASKESDMYSFGVVALEIATGRNAVGVVQQRCEMSLVQWVWGLYGEGKLSMAMDERLQLHGDVNEKQVECLMVVGLWCAHPDHKLRPTIRQAIQVLNFETEMPNLPVTMPVPIYQESRSPVVSSAEPLITCSSLELGR